MDFNKFIVIDNGSIDEDKTIESVLIYVKKFLSELKIQSNTIKDTINQSFDEQNIIHGITPLPISAVVGMTLTKLNADPDNYYALSKAIRSFIKDNSQGKKINNSYERPNSFLIIIRGSAGGIIRRSDFSFLK